MPDRTPDKNGGQRRIIVHGLKNCDACRRAMRWLDERNVAFTFHDVRADGLDRATLESWLDSEHSTKLLNRRSTTWRNFSEEQRKAALAQPAATVLEHPTLLKRPVITVDGEVLSVGFAPESLERCI